MNEIEKIKAVPLTRVTKYSLYLVSDSSGNLLEHFFNALLTQFPRDRFKVQTLPFIRNEAGLLQSLEKIREGIVFHAVIEKKLKVSIARECKKRGFPCFDVTGPAVEFLEKATGTEAALTPQPIHSVDSNYQGRMEALEFTMQHDDGRRIEELEKAEIILVGISRVSKSPNALFLAYRGFCVANVSVVPEMGLPEPLEKHRRQNVVALTLQPKRLAEIRQRRFANWQLDQMDYRDLPNVVREVLESERIYKEKGWPVIDTTDLAVEETSALILSSLNLKPKMFE